ncbi:hypothetical protein TNCV_1063471 [Trichonephila clavipes]|nr:hypothetical protein TNCV_1063471 [Trichonephila clavipes]
MKSLPIAPAYGQTYGSRISSQSEYLPGTHADQCDHRVRSLPKPLFHHLGNYVFEQCWIDDIWCFVPFRRADVLNRYPV